MHRYEEPRRRALRDEERAAAAAAPALALGQLLRTPGISNRSAAALIQRQNGDFSGPSYARHGPAGSVLEERRGALTPQRGLAEAEAQLSRELAQSAGWIGDGVMKLNSLVEDYRRSEREGKPFMGENTLDFASRMHQIAEALEKLSAGLLATAAKVKDADASLERLEQMDSATKAIGVVINALAALKAGASASEKLEAFNAKPSAQSAEAWADSIVDTFDAFGKVAGALDLPPGLSWIVDYWQGLLGAPKAYVGFFKATMRARYGQLDRTVGRLEGYHEYLRDGEKLVWAGPAVGMVSEAWFFDQRLQGWIRNQQEHKKGWTDLYVYGPRELALLLLANLDADTSIDGATKQRWGAWLTAKSRS